VGGRRGRRHQAVRLHEVPAGPGLGGHCIPIDPFYLSWKAREFDFWTEFIELAGKVNENMPYFCVEKLHHALNSRSRSLNGAKVLVLGVAYKADIDDLRESPALKVIRRLQTHGADVSYHDPYVPELEEYGLSSVSITDGRPLADYDAVVIVTAHSSVDYRRSSSRRRSSSTSATPPPASRAPATSGNSRTGGPGAAL
jgi:UDP-N-acetyl-D-glucosamine dehydrogenase